MPPSLVTLLTDHSFDPLNGDPIVVDLDTATVGFLLHDELWEDEAVEPRDVHSDTGLKIGSF